MKKQFWIKFGVMIAIVVGILVIDLVTKYVFDAQLGGEAVTVIPGLFNFKLVHNIGGAWGLLAGRQIFLIAISFVFLAIFIYYYAKEPNKTWLLNITFGFLIGGCLGNLFDRVCLGYVRDFIQFAFWQSFPVFNFADVFLCIGVVLFVIYMILYICKKSKKIEKNIEKNQKKHEKNENSLENEENHD